MRNISAAAIVALCGCAAGFSYGQTVSVSLLVKATDNVTGVGAVTAIDNLAVNNAGHWIAEVDTDGVTTSDIVLLKNGVAYLREADPLAAPTGSSISSFDAVNLNNGDNSGWNLFLDGTGGINNDSGIYFNGTLVLQEGTLAGASSGFSANTPYIGFFETKMNDSNQILVVASVDDPAIASTTDRAMVRLDYDATGGTILREIVLAKEGDVLSGLVSGVTDFGTTPQTFAVNNAGDAIFTVANGGIYRSTVDLSGPTPVVTTTPLAVNGGASPVAARNWATLASSEVDLSGSNYVFTANLSGDTATDFIIIKNGQKFIQEGDAPPGIAGTWALTAFGTSQIVQTTDAGDVLWFGDWNDPVTTHDTALFLNNTPILVEGVTTVGGLLITSVASGQDAYAISRNGRFVIAEVTIDDNGTLRNAAVLVEIGQACYANCDSSTQSPVLNVQDFSCFLQKYAAGDTYANCDGSTTVPQLNVADFSCFLQKYAAGCP